ncbi:hypothetical protein [Nocardia aurea]|uniref:Uncharacterized protein n=1 Tax=Nocardia aurea TaxID=2144174 RepID=A0ABV3FMK1_9NOCA
MGEEPADAGEPGTVAVTGTTFGAQENATPHLVGAASRSVCGCRPKGS